MFHSTPGMARTEALAGLCAPLRQEHREDTTMPSLSEIARDERTARMALSMLVEPDDAVTGRLLAAVGGVETLRLAEGDGSVPGLGAVDAKVWRGPFAHPGADSLEERVLQARRIGLGVLTQAMTSGLSPSLTSVSARRTCCGLAGPHRSWRVRAKSW